MMDVSIIVGIVGVGGVVVGNLISYLLRRWEMGALWAEEERRRKSDRRREFYEKELKTVSDATDVLVAAIGKVQWSAWGKEDWKTRAGWIREAWVMMWRASVVGISPMDQELTERFNELVDIFNGCMKALDVNTGEAREGKEEELEELLTQLRLAASKVRRRIGGLLEEV